MNRKKLVTLGLVGAMLLSAGAVAVTMFDQSTMRMLSSLGEENTTEFDIHDHNVPSEATEDYSTFVHEYTLGNGNKYTLKYTNAKKVDGAHIRLQNGTGCVEKADISKGIKKIRLQVDGNAWLYVSDNADYSGSHYRAFVQTTTEPTEHSVTGNYWKVVAEANTPTNINYLSVEYSCNVEANPVPYTSATLAHTQGTSSFNGITFTNTEKDGLRFTFTAEVTGGYNTDRLQPSHLVLFNGTHEITCTRLEYRSNNTIEAYFYMNNWLYAQTSNVEFYPHLKINGTTVGFNDSGDVRSPSEISLPDNFNLVNTYGNVVFGQNNWDGAYMPHLELNKTVDVVSKRVNNVDEHLDLTENGCSDGYIRVTLGFSASTTDNLLASSFVIKSDKTSKGNTYSSTAYEIQKIADKDGYKRFSIFFSSADFWVPWNAGERNDDDDANAFLWFLHLYVCGQPFNADDDNNLRTKWAVDNNDWAALPGDEPEQYTSHWFAGKDTGIFTVFTVGDMLVVKSDKR